MKRSIWILGFLFLGSGFAGLVYETIWIKEFSFVFGNTTYALSAVFAAYLAGLSLGTFVVGKYFSRVRHPIRVYAALEIAIALAGLVLFFLFKNVIRDLGAVGVLNNENVGPLTWRFVSSFVILLAPTFLMGGTLPILAQHFQRYYHQTGLTAGRLYGINTLGAALGAFFTGFFFIRLYGLQTSTLIAVGISLVIGVMALALGLLQRQQVEPAAELAAPEPRTADASPAVTRFLLIAFVVSGFTAFSYEILYSRILTFILGNRVFASSAMLTTFILGIALGSLIMARFLKNTRREPFIFAVTQIVIGITTFMTIVFYPQLLEIFRSMQTELNLITHSQFIVLKFFQAAIIMFIPTVGFGIIFPSIIQYLNRNLENISVSIGRAFALNTLGSITGILMTTFVIIPLLGAYRSMLLISMISLLLGYRVWVPDWNTAPRKRKWISAGATLALVAVLATLGLTFQNYPWPREGKDLIFAHEDASSLVTVYEGELGYYHYTDNTMVTYPIGRTPAEGVQKAQAHIPLLLHPEPREAAVIGLGYGATSGAFAVYDSLQSVHTVEIYPGVIASAKVFAAFNNGVHQHPKSTIVAGDGRYFLKSRPKKYDIIVSNVNEADLPGSTSCYSREYYQLLKTRLKPDGLVGVHMYGDYGRVMIKTLQQEFEYVEGFLGYNQTLFLVASRQPIIMDSTRVTQRLAANPGFFEDAQVSGLTSFEALTKRWILTDAAIDEIGNDPTVPIITDDHPILEYAFNPDRPNVFESNY